MAKMVLTPNQIVSYNGNLARFIRLEPEDANYCYISFLVPNPELDDPQCAYTSMVMRPDNDQIGREVDRLAVIIMDANRLMGELMKLPG